MGFTVADALKLPSFSEAKVIAGKSGLIREIGSLSVCECNELPVDLGTIGKDLAMDMQEFEVPNLLERSNQEVRRREKVVRIFPNANSANPLIGAVLMHQHEDWISSTRAYMKL